MKPVIIASLAFSLVCLFGCNSQQASEPVLLLEVKKPGILFLNTALPNHTNSSSVEGRMSRHSVKNQNQEEVIKLVAAFREPKDKDDHLVEATVELKNSKPFKFKVEGLKDLKVFQGDQVMSQPLEFPAGEHKFVIKGTAEP